MWNTLKLKNLFGKNELIQALFPSIDLFLCEGGLNTIYKLMFTSDLFWYLFNGEWLEFGMSTHDNLFNCYSLPFQNFLAANAQCWWNASLVAATRALKYVGHVAPGILLVTAEPCALEILRSAYARSVLKPPATYTITFVGK